MSTKILVYDDIPEVVKDWRTKLKRTIASLNLGFEVDRLKNDEFEHSIKELEKRRQSARENPGRAMFTQNTLIDEADIFIIDFDLFNLQDKTESSLTGENVAYLARCYSNCGLIIGLNQFVKQFGNNGFDLTLKGHPESFADLNLGDKQIFNKGLWFEPWRGFRPWCWALLPKAVEAFEKRVKAITKTLDEPILSFLGFPDEIQQMLPRSTIEFIGTTKVPEKTTFREFVVNSGNGLRGKDKPLNDEAIARIAGARIAKWLERLVLPGQDILVDAPHLVSRFPSLLKQDREAIEKWNNTASFAEVHELGIDHKLLKKFSFSREEWLSHPAWFWPHLSGYEQIEEVKDPWTTTRPDWVFCEDISRFLPRDATREFVADLSSQFVRRFVVNSESKKAKGYLTELRGIQYAPLVRFSL